MLRIVVFLLAIGGCARALANCPHGCQCDDNTLVVQCGAGQLDVLPIALNPSIKRLVIKSNHIKTIDSSIQFYAELTFLDLSANHLMKIPQRTFLRQHKLQELHLDGNKIGEVNNRTFIGLAAITVLSLRANLLSELGAGTFAPLARVEELNLGENRIGYVDARAFDGLTQLRILYMDDNELTSVPDPVIFRALPNLAELFVGMNTLLTLPPGAFSDLRGLTRLDLKGAGLVNISHDSFRGLEAMRRLDLSDNRLTRIPSLSLSHLVRLEELALGQNDFEVVAEGAFVGLKQLKRLDISGALRLKRVMNGAFAANGNLEFLNLSSNKMLAEVQEGALSGLPHLRHVILKANALTTLAEGLFPWKDLVTLDLTDSPIACDCRVMWLRNLLLSRNGSSSTSISSGDSDVVCEYPDRLRGESLKNLNPLLMGCAHTDPHKQALIGALLVGSAATVTALALILYRCRRRIRDHLKQGVWGNAALGGKEREYQKTFCDDDYMMPHQHHHPCGHSLHAAAFTNTYTARRPAAADHGGDHHYGVCPIAINEMGAGAADASAIAVNHHAKSSSFQQLQVPSAASMGIGLGLGLGEKALKGAALDDGLAFVMPKLNHYTKPQFIAATAAVADSCYSYADVPLVHSVAVDSRHHGTAAARHFGRDHTHVSDAMDANYIYSNTHYSLPLELGADAVACAVAAGRSKTPTPPPLPPALPLRNGLHAATIGRRSLNANNVNSPLGGATTMHNAH